jgi:hypothetical protein
MNLTLRIPDDVASRIAAQGGDLERRALEALALEEFRAGRMSKGDLRRTLGFEVLNEVDGFLKAHGVYDDYSIEDFEREQQAADRLGL